MWDVNELKIKNLKKKTEEKNCIKTYEFLYNPFVIQFVDLLRRSFAPKLQEGIKTLINTCL